jgi:hypothetical protein
MKTILLLVWLIILLYIFFDWLFNVIEQKKIKRMTQYERMVYRTKKYGKYWYLRE